jgi:hypothetical protein
VQHLFLTVSIFMVSRVVLLLTVCPRQAFSILNRKSSASTSTPYSNDGRDPASDER